MFLLWCIAAPKPAHQLKSLVKVPSDVRVPGCYFVHISRSASEEEMQTLVDELRTLDTNTSLPEFEAKDLFTITKLSYGFSAKLSNEALLYVSCKIIMLYYIRCTISSIIYHDNALQNTELGCFIS